MSKQAKSTTKVTESVAKRNRTLVAFVVGALIGVAGFSLATNAAAISYRTSPLAIGDITIRDQFEIGSWFRYDFKQWSQDGPQFYLVTTVINTTFTGSPDGDPIAYAKLGNTTWYTWDIRAYWMNDVEAISLYGRNDTGIYVWDNIAYPLKTGYSERHLRTLDDAMDVHDPPLEQQTYTSWTSILRPQFVNLGRLNNPSAAMFLSPPSAGFEHRTLIAGQWMHSYSRIGNNVRYDMDSLLLTAIRVDGREMCLTQYNASLRFPSTPTQDEVPLPGFDVLQGDFGGILEWHIVFSQEQMYRSWSVNITSNDTSVVPNVSTTKYLQGPVPVVVSGTGYANVTVTVVGNYFGVNSSPVQREYVITSGLFDDRPDNTTITNATDTGNNSILVEWDSVEGADWYYVYANETFVGQTDKEFFAFSPSVNGSYDIFVVVASNNNERVSEPSNIVTVQYNLTSDPFHGVGIQSTIHEPSSFVVIIILVSVLVAAAVVFFLLYRTGIVQSVASKTVASARKASSKVRSNKPRTKRKV